MRTIANMLLISALMGCVKIPKPEPGLGAITGVLVVGEPVTNICWQPVGTVDSPFPSEVKLVSGDIERELMVDGQCYFSPDNDFLPATGETIALVIREGGLSRRATVKIPPSPEGAEATNLQFNISTSTEHPVTTVSWNPLPDHMYALSLNPLANPLTAINFSGINGGNFEKELLNLQSEPSVALFNTDLTYYGLHKLTIYSIDADYASMFNYLPQFGGGPLGQGPGNFDLGPGFLGAVGKAEIYFEVLP